MDRRSARLLGAGRLIARERMDGLEKELQSVDWAHNFWTTKFVLE